MRQGWQEGVESGPKLIERAMRLYLVKQLGTICLWTTTCWIVSLEICLASDGLPIVNELRYYCASSRGGRTARKVLVEDEHQLYKRFAESHSSRRPESDTIVLTASGRSIYTSSQPANI
jgi:hypothetical protein